MFCINEEGKNFDGTIFRLQTCLNELNATGQYGYRLGWRAKALTEAEKSLVAELKFLCDNRKEQINSTFMSMAV